MNPGLLQRLSRRPDAVAVNLGKTLGVKVDGALSERLADELLKRVWGHATVGTVIATLFALFVAEHLKSSSGLNPVRIDYWLVLKLAVAMPRVLQAQIYNHSPDARGRKWRAWTYGFLALDGCVWGLGGLFAVLGDVPTASLVTACMVCVACVATFGLQVRVVATVTYVVPMIAMTALGMLLRQDEFGLFSTTGLAMFMIVLIATAIRSEKATVETFLLRERMARSAEERLAALELAEKNAREREVALEHAKRESATKSQFLATMSHELRTPLHGILGLSRLARTELQGQPASRRMDLIEASGQHLLGLINDLLDISRIEAGHLTLNPTAFDLYDELVRIVDIYRARTDEKGLHFNANIAIEKDHWVSGDPARVRQVLHNLLGNAVKFTEVGHVTLRAATPADDQVVFEVRDSGLGIPEEYQPRIFEKFSQAEVPGARPLEGTGLGLTIARELARAMGGDITFVSARGIGSSFSFTIELPRVAHQKHVGDATVVSLAHAKRALRPGLHVVLAEDNDVNAIVATEFLEREGLAVERVTNGQEAVDACARIPGGPDLVLMDVRMPIMDGISATRIVRARERALGSRPVPIVALTATAGADDLANCLAAGMSGCLPKPFSADELSEALSRWLDLGQRPAFQDSGLRRVL